MTKRRSILARLVLAAALLAMTHLACEVGEENPPAWTGTTSRPTSQRGGSEIRTAHYDVYAETLDANEVAAMLEQLHGRLKAFFGVEPGEPLRVEIYADRARWAAALRDDHQQVPKAGGYYAPATHKASAWVQPSAYFTRQLLLHEATHQFHWLSAMGNKGGPAWFDEGLAEYFGMHNWDGRTLQTGVVPAISLEDYPAKALEHFEKARWDLDGMIAGKTLTDRSEAWALVHFLVNKYPRQFHLLANRINRHDETVAAWKDVFGPTSAGMAKELADYLAQHQQPWRILWISWQQRGEAIEGFAGDTNALAVLKKTPKVLEAKFETPDGRGKAGLAVGCQSASEFYLLQVVGGDKFRVVRRSGGKWTHILDGPLPGLSASSRAAVTLTAEIEPDAITLKVNGTQVATLKVAGQVGLNVDSCKTLFHVITK